jgi:signal transduction histidine kinase
MFDFSLFSYIFFAAGALILLMLGIIWSRRPAPGLVPFCAFLFFSAFWSIFSGFEAGAVELSAKILFSQILYLAVVLTGVLWFFFALDYTGSRWWKRPRYWLWFMIIPAITLVLVWTNGSTGWIWSRVYLTNDGSLVYSVWEHGRFFLLNPIYQYCLYLAGFIVFIRFAITRPRFSRWQIWVLIAGTSLPCISSILYVCGISLIKNMDLTPLWIFVAAIFYTITILRFRFMHILPLAYRSLVDFIPEGVLILDPLNKVLEMNPAAESLLNTPKSALQGKSLKCIWPNLQPKIIRADAHEHFQLAVTIKNAPRYLDFRLVILTDKRYSRVGKLLTIRDISRFKATQNQLESEITKRSQYTRAVVHELRTPLTSIIAASDLLESIVADPTHLALARNIQRSADNLSKRVNELFELARGEVGLLKIDAEILDLCLLIEEVVAEFQPVASQKGLTLTSDCQRDINLNGDKNRLRQVLINLIGNAIKFTESGEIRVSMKVTPEQNVLIQVKDSGKGIPPAEMETLFDPYHRGVSGSTSTQGLGLGLTLSKIFIELHHGKIWADSQSGQGTTVSFTLPLP